MWVWLFRVGFWGTHDTKKFFADHLCKYSALAILREQNAKSHLPYLVWGRTACVTSVSVVTSMIILFSSHSAVEYTENQPCEDLWVNGNVKTLALSLCHCCLSLLTLPGKELAHCDWKLQLWSPRCTNGCRFSVHPWVQHNTHITQVLLFPTDSFSNVSLIFE